MAKNTISKKRKQQIGEEITIKLSKIIEKVGKREQVFINANIELDIKLK